VLLLAATLLFFPHYEITRTPDLTISLFSDPSGNAYVVSAAQNAQYISKIDPDGNLVYRVNPIPGVSAFSTMATVDASGNVYAVQTVLSLTGGPGTGYLTAIDPKGNIVSSFLLPLADTDTITINAIAAGPDGSVYLTGSASPSQLQTTPNAWVGVAQAMPNAINAFVLKLNPATQQLIYATFLDNSATNMLNTFTEGTTIAGDASGRAYVAGATDDPGFPTTAGAAQTQYTGAFSVVLAPDGSRPVYSTFLPGGNTPTSIAPVAVGGAQLAVTGGSSFVNGYPVPSELTTFLIAPAGNAISDVVATSLASLINEDGLGATAAIPDGLGNILVTGSLAPTDLPVSTGALANGANFAAVVRVSDGALLYSTRFPDGAVGVAVAPDGNGGLILAGTSQLTRLVPASQAQPTILGMANVAAMTVSPGVAPGEIVSIYGANLGPAQGASGTYDSTGHIPTNLAGTQIYFNSIPGPVLYAGANQINAIAPFEITGQTVNVTVQANGVASNTPILPEPAADPQVFQVLDPKSPNYGWAIAVNQDGTLNSQQNPATPGSIETVFLNGAGLLTPAPSDGERAPAYLNAVLPVSVQLGVGYFAGTPFGTWLPCQVLYAGSEPDEVAGKLQINFQIPSQSAEGGPGTFRVAVGAFQSTFNLRTP
jgi:uncharacterized protein (TIGR03437 family)